MTGSGEDQARHDGASDDPSTTLRPGTVSVLAALAARGVDLPGVTRPAGEAPAVDAPRYTVLDQVARGGMGVVLRVRDEDLRRELAMKVLDRADREPDAAASNPRDLGRFLEEAQVTGQLDHPGVPAIHELGLDQDGRLFFTMKLVRGGTFADVIAAVRDGSDGWTTTRALGVVLKVCEAMAYAHHKGVIHRDIKPANIMVGRFGETYVMDWGLAKVLGGESSDATRPDYASLVSRSIVHTDRREAADDAGTSHATLDGDVVGTPAYMAPEQARGDMEAMGTHSDIYAVGALLYHLIARQAPYLEPGVRVSPHTVLRWVLDGPPKALSELAPDAPPELVAIVEKAMAREPGLRYTSMLDLAADVQAFIEDRVVRAYQSGAWAEARKWVARNKPLAAAAGLLLLVTLGSLASIGWIQASSRAEVEERNDQLAEVNGALEGANIELASTNDELATKQQALVDSNARLEDSNAELARQQRALEESNNQLAETNAALEDSNTRLAEAIGAVERSNAQLGEANDALEQTNLELASTNQALDVQRDEADAARADAVAAAAAAERAREAADRARQDAIANAERAAENELRALEQSYAANMSAAAAALQSGSAAAARRHLEACPEHLRGWDWEHLALRADPSLDVWPGSESLIWDIEHSPDGSLIALGAGPYWGFGAEVRETRLLDANTGEVLEVLPNERPVPQVAFSADGHLLASGTSQYVSLWDITRRRRLATRHWTGGLCVGLEFIDDDRVLVLSVDQQADTSRLDLWNTASLSVEWSREDRPAATCLAVSPGGASVALGHTDFSLTLLDLAGEDDTATRWTVPGFAAPSDVSVAGDLPGITDMVFDAEGLRLVATGDQAVRLFDTADGRELANRAVTDGTSSPRFHPDGPWIVLADSSGSVRFLDARTLDEIERLAGHDQFVSAVSIHPDGDRLVSAGMDGSVRVWDGRPGAASLVIPNRAATSDMGGPGFDRAVCFSPDGRHVVWVPSPKVVLVADALTGELLFRLAEADSAVGGLAFTPDGRHILVQCEVGGVLTFDSATGELLDAAPGGNYADWASFDPSGSLMAVVESRLDNRIDIRVVSNGVRALTLVGHADFVSAGRFSEDSQRLVTCSFDGSIRTWDLRSGEALEVIPGDDQLNRIELFDGDRRALTTSWDPTRSGLSVWDLERGERAAFHPARAPTMHGGLHPDGRLWAGATRNDVSLWDLERGEMFSIPAGSSPLSSVRFDPTGKRLAAVDMTGRLYLWDTEHPSHRRGARRAASALARRAGEARVLVDTRLAEHLLVDRVIDALERDPDLDDDLRRAAIREARIRGDDLRWVLARCWERLLPESVADGQLDTDPVSVAAAAALLPTLREVAEFWPQYMDAWEPLMWAEYVVGRLDEAAILGPLGRDAGYSIEPGGPQIGIALEALVSAAQGDQGSARVQLREAREELERAKVATPGEYGEIAANERLLALAEARVEAE